MTTSLAPSTLPRSFHVMTKPVGPICNLDCKYCFYLEKEKLYPGKSNWRMPDDVLERYVRDYIAAQEVPQVSFAWQGGEPTLMGVDFFRRVVELQQRYANGKSVSNAMQTNGTLLDDEWCEFLKSNQFLIGLSIDGPRKHHDLYRVDKSGNPTFDRVVAAMRLLKKHAVDFNTLCVVSRANSLAPLDTYRFLKSEGSGYVQFIPLVERAGGGDLPLAEPPTLVEPGRVRLPVVPDQSTASVTPWSVEPLAYGNFLCAIFDEWVRRDVGRVFVQIFDVQLGITMGYPSTLCVFGETCGNALALEHNGDLYSCDHYVYPQYRLGNVANDSIAELVASPAQRKFGADKRDTLPKYCRECDVRAHCNGECPKHRFLTTPDGEPGLNYLCAGYKKFFRHMQPYMRTMSELMAQGRPAAEIMRLIAEREQPQTGSAPGRNDLCPCGSGKKYKKCCGK
ncbi:MAG TPA: anaerobic sulfatase maturase [Tepidisphaeraceae bacterium]|nr:anaerobic sulfatase maturase [Tepidisphaeraceae bacterium]